MTTFKLETSGAVARPPGIDDGGPYYIGWPDLPPFVQGYIEAAFKSASVYPNSAILPWERHPGHNEPQPVGFSDLAPETLARIMEDCAVFFGVGGPWFPVGDYETGKQFWRTRQKGQWAYMCFRPLTLHLSDDGKVRFTV